MWRRGSALHASPCPYCRQRITILLPYFSQEERDTADIQEIQTRTQLLQEVQIYIAV